MLEQPNQSARTSKTSALVSTERPPLALSTVLSGERAMFIIQKGAQFSKRLGEVFAEIHESAEGNLALGALVTPSVVRGRLAAAEFLGQKAPVTLRIFDPELFRHPSGDGPKEPHSDRRAAEWSFLGNPLPVKPHRLWTSSVLDAQREAGANVLLSATGWVSDVNPDQRLSTAFSFVDESRWLAEDSPMFVNLTFGSRWLSEPALRAKLLERLVESNERLWYLRFRWPVVTPRYGQLADASIMRGYRELSETAAMEGKVLLLPNTGLTGWLATALGATGFSTGTSWRDQAYADQLQIRSAKNRTVSRIPRIFDSALLHTIEFREFKRLEALNDHQPYRSRFLAEIEESIHSAELAGLHGLVVAGWLQHKLSSRNSRLQALRLVQKTEQFLQRLDADQRPSGPNLPRHLPLWRELLE